MVNGSNVEEGKNNGAAIIPNLDSISEFRIITNNFDAEYGNYSGGQINVVTKSGTNQFHGSGFEFLRNTVLDAKNYYSLPTDKTPVFQQNQFGGHIRRTDQERQDFLLRRLSGHSTESGANGRMRRCRRLANFAGNFSRFGEFAHGCSSMGQSVGQPFFRRRLGYTVTDQEPYYTPGCTTNANCVFPNAVIPQNAWSPVAVNMLKLGLIPQPNAPNNFFEILLLRAETERQQGWSSY